MHIPFIMDFYGEGKLDLEIQIINIMLNELQNKQDFEKKMMVLEESIDMIRDIFEKEPEKVLILFKELLDPIS